MTNDIKIKTWSRNKFYIHVDVASSPKIINGTRTV